MDEKTYTGTIKEVEQKDHKGYEKYLVTIIQESGDECYIEFRNTTAKQALEGFSKGDHVEIYARLAGCRSKLSRQHHNNLIARTIKKVN